MAWGAWLRVLPALNCGTPVTTGQDEQLEGGASSEGASAGRQGTHLRPTAQERERGGHDSDTVTRPLSTDGTMTRPRGCRAEPRTEGPGLGCHRLSCCWLGGSGLFGYVSHNAAYCVNRSACSLSL